MASSNMPTWRNPQAYYPTPYPTAADLAQAAQRAMQRGGLSTSALAQAVTTPAQSKLNDTQKECTGYDFAVGAAVGIRSWGVDKLGRLFGAAEHIWTPGEQIAHCEAFKLRSIPKRLPRSAMKKSDMPASIWAQYVWDAAADAYVWSGKPPVSGDDSHDMGSCTCGFYAYHDGVPSFGRDGWVAGVIEGWGKTTIGTRGFRSSKAKIVALALPVHGETSSGPRWTSSRYSGCGCDDCSSVVHSVTPQQARAIRRNYAGVDFYDSITEMVAAHPLDSQEPTPETDPDFWTRSAS